MDLVIQNIEQNDNKLCNYDIILIDCNMPVMDGYQATIKIRQFIYDKGLLQPIIVACTGHVEDSFVSKCLNCGMNLVLKKPVDGN